MTERLRKYLVISDIHLGCRTTPADYILRNLRAYFGDFRANSQFVDLDAIFIAGDLWDDTLDVGSKAWLDAIPWFGDFVRWCALYKIAIRILKGTPRHDREQCSAVEQLVASFKVDVDFKYISTLSIDRDETLGLSVLYVPDECRPTAEACQRDVEALLDEAGLTKVDIAIMHGMFKFQLGTIPMNVKVHDEAWYLAHVKHYINIGHVHSMQQYLRILGQGSFDRLAHGEEEPKGGMLIEEVSPGEWVHFFIENPGAKIYKTVSVKGSIEDAFAKIDSEIRSLPQGSYVRIKGDSKHPIFQGLDALKQRYPLFTFSSKKVVEDEDEVKQSTEVSALDYVPIVLNRDTITEALFGEVTLKRELTVNEEQRLYHLLQDLHV